MLKTKKLTEETRMLRQQKKHKDHRELKNQNGKNISVESGVKTWQFFFENKLYDELWLCLQPIVAGNGEKIFYDGFPKLEMKLKDTTQYQDGVIKLIYERI